LDSPSVSAAKPTLTLSPVELLKITPESRTFQNIIYEPRVWGGRGSFSVAFLKFSYMFNKMNEDMEIIDYLYLFVKSSI
jgi:hypothetical protein